MYGNSQNQGHMLVGLDMRCRTIIPAKPSSENPSCQLAIIQGLGLRVLGLGLRILGLRVSGSGFKVWGYRLPPFRHPESEKSGSKGIACGDMHFGEDNNAEKGSE